ncbi:MAG TPA: tRNA uridine-5-carboxymethylaminomethyl(34) synthesis GTPase MnmE [Acholeplasmataceae bacterium]|nr:tRNA uridine-5-carboxymethylaminomethyl(34) synthesis GTPase MnmE [Acholeplasmataceae bacterium]
MNDTIAAIATALANKAISIIRVSGPEAIDIVNKIFVGKDLRKVPSHTIHYGKIKIDNRIIDEVLVSVFHAPKTFTREDVVEVNCHGGIYVTNTILEGILVKGARLADPGEFTKRAFLNGRIDLTQAEAIMDIIESNTASSLQMANYGLTGKTKRIIEDFKNRVLSCIASIEVNIDYPEYEDEIQMTNEVLMPIIVDLLRDMDEILKKAEVAQIIKYGIKTAIVGKPNVGKSSLLNALLREDKAIVTNIAGTTRDIVEGEVNIGGIVLNLIDTAGVRVTEDLVERIGVEKTKEVLKKAELVILVFDYSRELDNNDLELLEATKDKTRIIVVNKRDLPPKIDLSKFTDYLLLSSYNEDDIEKLEKKIKEVCNVASVTEIDPTYIGNTRQLAKLKIARESLESALNAIELNLPVDIVNIDINNAWLSLGEILGEVTNEDLLDELFANFCLGK